ncbi:hypothetical protein GCM10022251_81800 [Phytohabitans flavus]|uniref:FtsX extracellular domain-containing protein n=1 Tax=Phytohabitans flavus TaxID=1076124 RepID=A0A6F8XV98_9ACTN|nr:permease-like cell division protein FtsX [Phytohabitans flavus]BCB77740.1 hypothetical protein Pflav_041500 [Phytohabitans flavus]
MRKILLVLFAALAGAMACSTARGEEFDTKEKPRITVFLDSDSTREQRDAVEAAIRAQVGFDTVEYESPEEAYAQYKSLMEDDPAFDASVRPEKMPHSFRFTTTDLEAMPFR